MSEATKPQIDVTPDFLFARIGALDIEKRLVEVREATLKAQLAESEQVARLKVDAMLAEIEKLKNDVTLRDGRIAELKQQLAAPAEPDPFDKPTLPFPGTCCDAPTAG